MRLLRRLSCEEVTALASDYIDGVLPPRLTRLVEKHLAGCPNCPRYVEQLRLTKSLTGRLRADDVPDEVVEALTQAFEEARRPDPRDDPTGP